MGGHELSARIRGYRLAVVRAETAFEVYMVDWRSQAMVAFGTAPMDTALKVEQDHGYWSRHIGA